MRIALLPLFLVACTAPQRSIAPRDTGCTERRIAADRRLTRALRRVPPRYPPGAYHRGVEGWVCVAFTVGVDGQVEQERVVESAPPRVFDASALASIRRWQFVRDEADPAPLEDVRVVLRYRRPSG